MFTGSLKEKTFDSKKKTSFFGNRFFASKDGWGTSSGRLGATPTGPGGKPHASKKACNFKGVVIRYF
jgi:hypothetical protein